MEHNLVEKRRMFTKKYLHNQGRRKQFQVRSHSSTLPPKMTVFICSYGVDKDDFCTKQIY